MMCQVAVGTAWPDLWQKSVQPVCKGLPQVSLVSRVCLLQRSIWNRGDKSLASPSLGIPCSEQALCNFQKQGVDKMGEIFSDWWIKSVVRCSSVFCIFLKKKTPRTREQVAPHCRVKCHWKPRALWLHWTSQWCLSLVCGVGQLSASLLSSCSNCQNQQSQSHLWTPILDKPLLGNVSGIRCVFYKGSFRCSSSTVQIFSS